MGLGSKVPQHEPSMRMEQELPPVGQHEHPKLTLAPDRYGTMVCVRLKDVTEICTLLRELYTKFNF